MSLATCADLTLCKAELISLINQKDVPIATTIVAGKIEVATGLEVQQGVIDTAAVTPLTLRSALQSTPGNNLTAAIVDAVQTSIGSDTGAQAAIANSITDEIVANITANTTYLSNLNGSLPQATTALAGKVELATTAETIAGTDTERAVTPAALNAAITAAKQLLWPIGSVYINASSTANPSTLLGFGTWVAIGAGRVLVGQDTSDSLFDSLEETGGSKDAAVVSHSHTYSGNVDSVGDHQHLAGWRWSLDGSGATGGLGLDTDPVVNNSETKPAGAHSHSYSGTTNSTGSPGTNANLQPYLVVKMWKRTA